MYNDSYQYGRTSFFTQLDKVKVFFGYNKYLFFLIYSQNIKFYQDFYVDWVFIYNSDLSILKNWFFYWSSFKF